MEIRELGPGGQASDDSDKVVITTLLNGKCGFTGTVLDPDGSSVHTVSESTYNTPDEALNAALSWADSHRVRVLYVERSTA